MGRFTVLLEQRPGTAFALFAVIHAVLWTALPSLFFLNLPLDLIEALTYGREWQLGHDKLPPLPWWMVEVAYRLTGSDVAYYAMAQVTVLAALAIVWALARKLVGPLGALASVLIVDGLHYFTFTAAKFNHDVLQLPLWALAGYCLHAGLRTRSLVAWLGLGVALGGALWAKYFVVILAAPLALFLLLDREARPALARPGPWLAALAALVIAAAHLAWLVANDFLPFAYANARAQPSRGLVDHVWHPVIFTASQLSFLLPGLVVAAALVWPRGAVGVADKPDAFDRRIVTLLAFGPAAMLIALSAATGRGLVATWGYPLWLFAGLWIVIRIGGVTDARRLARAAMVWAVMTIVFAAAFVTAYAVQPRFDQRYRAVLFPGERLAAELSTRFRTLTGKPLTYVVSEMWTGGNVGHYALERPRVLIDGNPRRAPWIDLADLRAKGAVVVWTEGDPNVLPPAYREIAGAAEVQPPFTLPYRLGRRTQLVGWAVLRPER